MTETAECQNGHGPDGIVPCWSPGGPCPTGQTVCETCGPCYECRPGEHPLALTSAPPLNPIETAGVTA